MFAPFVFTNDRLSTVRATEASLSVLHEIFYDDTLVIDDFNREGSEQEVRDKMRNIRALIRAYSDKTLESNMAVKIISKNTQYEVDASLLVKQN